MAFSSTRARLEELDRMAHSSRGSRRRSRESAPVRRVRQVDRSNTMGPSEEVEERRTHRKRVVVSQTQSNATRTILAENLFFLVFLIASLYGVYRLAIHVLNQV